MQPPGESQPVLPWVSYLSRGVAGSAIVTNTNLWPAHVFPLICRAHHQNHET